jgi:hypothetical protein
MIGISLGHCQKTNLIGNGGIEPERKHHEEISSHTV